MEYNDCFDGQLENNLSNDMKVDSSLFDGSNAVGTDVTTSHNSTCLAKEIPLKRSSYGTCDTLSNVPFDAQGYLLGTRNFKKVEKQRRLHSLKRFKKDVEHISYLSNLDKSENGFRSCGVRKRKVKLQNSGKQVHTDSENCGEIIKLAMHTDASNKERLDSREYRKYLRLQIKDNLAPGNSVPMTGKRAKMPEDCKEVTRRDTSKVSGKDMLMNFPSPSKRKRGLKPNYDIYVPQDGQRGRKFKSKDSMEFPNKCYYGEECPKPLLGDRRTGGTVLCLNCFLGGELLCCNGKDCKRQYHPSCLDPPLSFVPPGIWYCSWCIQKKIELGVYSVSRGVECIWSAREVFSDKDEQLQKQYLVKYQGLAHAYNRWILETELLLVAPKLLEKFNRKIQVISWKMEWSVPHRLLQNRMIVLPKQHGTHFDECRYEWLVKWTGLGYDHATWELDDAPFMKSPEGIKLKEEYEIRHRRNKRCSSALADMEDKDSFAGLSELSACDSSGLHNHNLDYVNKLRKCWCEGQNALLIDEQSDQDRALKIILFILSLHCHTERPFLIISTPAALSAWEAEFLHLAPTVDVVVYKGNRDVRRSIRSVEFYDKNGSIMFEVLLSSPDVVVEDFHALESIIWEAIIIDECQRPRMSKHFDNIKMLATGVRLLVVSGQIKECQEDYLYLLSLLECYAFGRKKNGTDIGSHISELKGRLAQYVAFECKSASCRFIEYWVPAQLSNLQLEQYCATLLSNSMLLCSCLKNDSADALRDLVVSIRKCCDHPYLVDQSLQGFVTKGLPVEKYLDVGIDASGKLQLLDRILLEMKRCGFRVMIVFQSMGRSGDIGDILDDYISQRFGKDSYVRIDGTGYFRSKKQAALDMFNDKGNGKFVFLIENRACLHSIKITSVDAVILFDSDLDPQNDLRALQRISVSSQFPQLILFRLYSSFTLEEKILILAKEGAALDCNVQTLSHSTCHAMLGWHASYLFNKLDKFHSNDDLLSTFKISCEHSILNDVLHEISSLLPSLNCYKVSDNHRDCSLVLKVEQMGGRYANGFSLLGERNEQVLDNELSVLWAKLLEGRRPEWKLLTGSSQRIRKKVNYFDLRKELENEKHPVRRNGRKAHEKIVDPVYMKSKSKTKKKLKSVHTPSRVSDKKCASNTLLESKLVPSADYENASLPSSDTAESVKERVLIDAHKGTHLPLKPDVSELCDSLHLAERIKITATRIHDHIRKYYDVGCDSIRTEQAFVISICWMAASLLKYKINKKESVAVARQQLRFDCEPEEAGSIYLLLKKIKKTLRKLIEKSLDGVDSSKLCKQEEQDMVVGDTHGGDKTLQCSLLMESTLLELPPQKILEDLPIQQHNLRDPDLPVVETTSDTMPSGSVAVEPDIIERIDGYRHYLVPNFAPPSEDNSGTLVSPGTDHEQRNGSPVDGHGGELLPSDTDETRSCSFLNPQIMSGSCTHVPSTSDVTLNVHLSHDLTSMDELSWVEYSSPLQSELDRIQKKKEEALRIHEKNVTELKLDCAREIKNVYEKYDMLFQDAMTALVHKREELKSYQEKVYMNKLLAEALIEKVDIYKARGPPCTKQETDPEISGFEPCVSPMVQLSGDPPNSGDPSTNPSSFYIPLSDPILEALQVEEFPVDMQWRPSSDDFPLSS